MLLPFKIAIVSAALCILASAARCQTPEQLFASGQFEPARKAYAAAALAAPADASAQVGQIRSLLRLDRWDEALTAASAFAARVPSSADAHGLLALSLIRAGWQPPYADEAKRALALDPQTYWGLVASARAADWDGHPEDARAQFRKASQIHPELPDAWLGLLETLDDDKDAKEKASVAAVYLKLKPQGQPHDREIEEIQDFEANAKAYQRGFGADPPFQQVEAGKNSSEKSASAAQLKIEFVGDYAVFPVVINDKKFRLLFDTGAGDLLLTQGAAHRLNLPVLARSFIRGVNGRQRTEVIKADRMTFGSLAYRSIPVRTMSLAPAATDGILGGGTLDDCVITLDYTTASATLGPAAALPSPLPGDRQLSMPFRIYRDHLFVQVRVNTQPLWAMLDTGAEQSVFSLRLAKQQLKSTPKDEYRTGSFTEKVGIGDTAKKMEYIFSRDESTVSLGDSPPISLPTETFGASFLDSQTSPGFDFEIGMLFGVSSFTYAQRVTFDYPHKIMTFEYADPDAKAPAKTPAGRTKK